MKIWIVMGTSGEYSDRRQWPVIAYDDEARAAKHADDAMLRAKKELATIKTETLDWDTDVINATLREKMGDLDPFAQCVYGSDPPDYFTLSVELKTA